MTKMYSVKFPITNEEFFHHDLHQLYNLVISHGIELMREYGCIGKCDVVKIRDDYYDTICSIHFGQRYSELGSDFCSIRVRARLGKNNKDKVGFCKVRKYKLYR